MRELLNLLNEAAERKPDSTMADLLEALEKDKRVPFFAQQLRRKVFAVEAEYDRSAELEALLESHYDRLSGARE